MVAIRGFTFAPNWRFLSGNEKVEAPLYEIENNESRQPNPIFGRRRSDVQILSPRLSQDESSKIVSQGAPYSLSDLSPHHPQSIRARSPAPILFAACLNRNDISLARSQEQIALEPVLFRV